MTLASARIASNTVKPLVMLLQGPVGPFFRDLHQHLIDRGFDVIKVNFNGGDLLFSPRGSLNFRGSPADWSIWLSAFVVERRPAAIVLFGDGRPYHIEALQIANAERIVAWCLEEGYIRPNHITCEQMGNNAHSSLRQQTSGRIHPPIAAEHPIESSFGVTAIYAALYSVAQAALSASFRKNIRHRQRPVLTECVRWSINVFRKFAFYRTNRIVLDQVLNHRMRDYYVVALQVHDDLNLLRNGNNWTMERLIDETTRSFAEHAPRNHRLLFKVHPLDRGHRPYRKLVAKAARAWKCEARVTIVDDGPIGPIIRHSEGVITVNSTSGLIALWQGRPLIALGEAVYSTVALNTLSSTDPAELDSFWRRPKVAGEKAVSEFLERMRRESLINGSFYLAPFRSATADAVAEQIQNEFVSAQLVQLRAMTGERPHPLEETKHARRAG
jgi:capsular polysaccharide export protein